MRAVQFGIRSLFGVAVVASLGFGAVQLTAKPAEAAARACFDEYCDDYCVGKGYTYGFCDTTLQRCACFRV
ncbi:MAG TPA: hypothetical protein VGV85_06635 [Longimicrobiaceae bacterium]|nr:hypothetical protein [Longimicrobiaceae bacterium]